MDSSSAVGHQTIHSLGLGAQTLARGPGWQLTERPGNSWTLRLDSGVDEPLQVWSDMLDAVRIIAETQPLRPLLIDMRGAGHLLTDTGRTPAELRGQVTSPGGTTAAAVHILEEKGFRALVEDAVRAAAERSRQLGESPP